ncbi:DMT family transporter [Paraburkholderia sartisoli]|uniref:Permease of the drug/metabolite transporter (DMT) superfamily n=1 Tax=Paraburkholderia sartisoli TaxID=83784 RepID=A0A1H4HIY8_9BURK|nr:DMT family transporter [Paraburkholderia sartisoli]SEB21032.1 Permease of the drug/metabolite transporter (DMT) superfamily [Paraburkholderia sartisoli]
MSSPTTASTRSLPLSAIGNILASMFCFAVVDALAKTVALQYPANEVTFFRMLFGLIPAVVVCCTGRLSWSERLANLDVKGQTVRALTLLGASGLFFAGLPYVPLGEAVALAYSETLIVILLAPLILHERMTRRGVAAAIAGFCGVLLVARPAGGQSSWLGPTLLLMSAFFGALSIVQIKRIRSTDDPETMVLFFTLVGTLVTGCTLFFSWRNVSMTALLTMAILGTFATAGQLLMTVAFRQADAGKLAPYNYTSIVWAAVFGYVIWDETMQPLSLVGIALIVGSAIAVAVSRKDPEGPLA